ncbi:TPA: hypothetical protein ACXEN4_005420 [Klebsiella pneumoniae]|uniref:hypothetical protein n=2 Tax=Klebsiella pneumoniae complex TaxID=3390273 RepID=UPI0018607865|nr:hypothetical protein [Klebsiella variicola]MEA4231437.1 hypothetical protein [Klebsiella pneumoniae]HBT4844006.1 hypothetical protein [Klebsiella variicola subsp. variicola]MEA4512049.1 hypothetical protein [Klebsiella pneumoniae]MEA4692249.1 hypothetical protein [Klebsiella pneumoniae]QNF10116.1 hypothetical protein DUZ89_11200 [Klebsiella variicola]
MAFNPELGSTSPAVLLDNAERLDKLVNGPAADVPDRGGDPLYSWRQMIAKNDEIRQNLIPLSKQYATLAAAQADIANIPEGSTTYYRSPDDSALAIEVMNVGGTLQSTGRKMPSSQAVDSVRGLIDSQGENPFSVVFKNGLSPFGYKDGRLYADEFQKLYSSDAGLEFGGSIIDNNPPDGWRFVIYYRNGLVMCGQRNDGTMIGFGEGGSGGGSIEPGDTAADYDSIRNYTGTATVRDVVGQRTGGRFVVNPDDTTSEEIPGGILVDVLGRRWYRQAEFVNYDQFLASRVPGATLLAIQVALAMGNTSSAIAYLSAVSPSDQAIQNAHRYANMLKIPVRQPDGAFLLLVDHEAEVRTDTDLSGAIIFTSTESGVNEIRWGPLRILDPSAPEPPRMFNIKGKERIELTAAELTTFNASYAQYLKKGSQYLPYPKLYPYYGGMFYALSTSVELYRNGDMMTPRNRVLYREFSRIGRQGALTERIVKNIPDGTIGYAAIIPKEDNFLTFRCPHFIELGDSRRFVNIEISRPMVHVKDLVHSSLQTASASLESRVVVSGREVFDVFCDVGEATCHPAENGSYGICIRDTCNVHINRYYGLHGWGFQGHHGIKGLYVKDSTFNRMDFHSFGYDCYFDNMTLKGRQANLQGGNDWKFRNLKHIVTRSSGGAVEPFLNFVIGMRQDYASDCECNLVVDGLTVMWDKGLAAWYNGSLSYDVARIIDTANSMDQGIDSKLPYTIDIRNVVFDLAGIQEGKPNGNFEFSAVTALRSQFTDHATTGKKTLLPDNITVDGMTAINVQPTQNAVMCGIKMPEDLYKNTVGSRNKKGSDGTNARITLRNLHSVINNPSIELAAAQTVDIPGDAANWTADYLSSDYSWIPRITLENCIPAIIHAPGAKAVVDIHGGKLARIYTNGNGNRCRVTGADIELIPDASGVTYFAADKTLVTGCSWLNPASGATYPGTLRGSGNEMIGESAKAPNLPAKAFIEE